MSFLVHISLAAERDVRDAFLWYSEKSVELANRFENNVTQVINDLAENPFTVQLKYKNIHVSFLRHFPYGVHFKVEDQTIIILAVLHTARKPRVE